MYVQLDVSNGLQVPLVILVDNVFQSDLAVVQKHKSNVHHTIAHVEVVIQLLHHYHDNI
jgi:hypothetical protein